MKALTFLLASGLAIQPVSSRAAEVVSTSAPEGNISGAGHSWLPILSADGRFLVFLSHANNLVTNDNPRSYLEVFISDLAGSNTTLVTVNASGTAASKGDSAYPAISADGRFILFASEADNLVSNDTNGVADVFLRDVAAGSASLVSVNTNGIAPRASLFTGRPISRRPVMTPDARWVVFESYADDLVVGDTNRFMDLFVRDMQNGITRLITVGTASSGRSHSPSITPNGRRIAFISSAAGLSPGATNGNSEVFVRDLAGSTTIWASSNLAGYFNNTNAYKCFYPQISPDGTHVAFKGSQIATGAVVLFYHDLDSGSTAVIATNTHLDTSPAFSSDGRWLAFEENDAIYLRDLLNEANLLVSINAAGTGPANGISFRPVMPPDAQKVAFVSSATDLTPNLGESNAFQIYVRDPVAGTTTLVSVNTNGLASASDMHAVAPSISADGQRIAFDTDADDIVPGDYNKASDVFVRDLAAQRTRLISARRVERPARTGVQSAGTFAQSLSADGQRILFSSLDDPRTPFDTNGHIDAFVHDLSNGSVTALSVGPGAPSPTNGSFFEGLLSANGAAAVFLRETRTQNYWAEGTQLFWRPTSDGPAEEVPRFTYDAADRFPLAISPDGETVVYRSGDHLVWTNMTTGSNGLVSQPKVGGFFNVHGPSLNPSFSHNGRFVAFASSAATLVSNLAGPYGRHLYIRDLQSNVTHLISLDANGAPLATPNPTADPTVGSTAGVFSGNDRYIVFDGKFGTNRQPHVYRYDLQTGQNQLITSNGMNPAINYDGQVIAYSENYRSIYVPTNIYVMDLATGQGRSITTDYLGNNIPDRRFNPPLLSSNGRYVVFSTDLSNLVLQDTNRSSDIFVHDRLQRTTTLISRSRFGPRAAGGTSSRPAMSADGRTVAFQSFANDLVEGDYNERRDVFVVRLGTGDSDNDGMDDDWEVAFFGNLGRDGAADFDHDGHSDLQEFLAGTDPTNTGSILRVLTVTPMSGGGNTTIVWSAVPGRPYVVQFKDSVNAPNWSNASGVLMASSTSESFPHASSAPQRFYRVIAVQ